MTPDLAYEGLGVHAAAAGPLRCRPEEAPPTASPSGSCTVTSVSPGRSRRVNSKTNGRLPRFPQRDFFGCLLGR